VPDANTTSGLDIDGALKRLGGNSGLYQKLLGRFRDSYTADAPALVGYLAAGDLASAEREAHTIKGLAGSLGAGELQAAAAEMERACKSGAGKDDCQTKLVTMQAALQKALEAIDGYLKPAAQPSAAPRAVNKAALAGQLAGLMALFEDNDGKAVSLFASLLPDIQAVAPDMAAPLRQAVDNFDFGEALALTAALTARLAP
jgi:two-component system sensor histidine kinase/response regulator